MYLAAIIFLAVLYITFAWRQRNILDIANTIVTAAVINYFFGFVGLVMYSTVSLFVLRFECWSIKVGGR